MSVALVILAAGKGTRMQSELPKVLHHLAGMPMLGHVINTGNSLSPERMIIVAGHGAQAVDNFAKDLNKNVETVLQPEQLGTGHAVDQARKTLADFHGNIIIIYGDTPLLKSSTLANLSASLSKADLSVLGFETETPDRYGRLVVDNDNLKRIIEFKDASKSEKAIKLCNSGVMAISRTLLFELLTKINNQNASGEFYLTDIVEHAVAAGKSCKVVQCNELETVGVNSRADLSKAELEYQNRRRDAALKNGVTMLAPSTVHFSYDTNIGCDTIIEQNVVFGPGVTVETGSQIKAFSHLEGAFVARGSIVGPYARLRPGTQLERNVKIGNFVEVKESRIATGAKVNHLSYLGNASIGARANIGAGTITCNFDGVMKHQTEIGTDAFIGSNTMLVAPVSVGKEALTASGSVIVNDVPNGALALGRSKQVNKPGLAIKLLAKFRSLKAAKKE
jgi:bifunctional UDP-N-acetylglucosamine pyrophosphorylase/glucosamine-1-phosphate N-acetyltransferase